MKRAKPIDGIRQRLRVLVKAQGLKTKFSTDLVKMLVDGFIQNVLIVRHSDAAFVPSETMLDGIKIVYSLS
jgi:hypothetical protein